MPYSKISAYSHGFVYKEISSLRAISLPVTCIKAVKKLSCPWEVEDWLQTISSPVFPVVFQPQ